MDNNELAQRVFDNGTYLVTVDYYNQKVNLYAVDADFFEVYYDQANNEIVRISQASELDMLKYINRINVDL